MMLRSAILLIALCTINIGYAQRFRGGFTAGLNATQLDGDLLAGYNKVGLRGGFWINYPFNKKWSAQLEFLYMKKGASRTISEDSIASTRTFDKFNLHYIEVPLIVAYTYKNFTFQAGLTGGYLISASVTDFTGKRDYKNNLKTFEAGTLLGAEYKIFEDLHVGLRWQYSIASLAKNDNRNILQDNALSPPILGLYSNLIGVYLKYDFTTPPGKPHLNF